MCCLLAFQANRGAKRKILDCETAGFSLREALTAARPNKHQLDRERTRDRLCTTGTKRAADDLEERLTITVQSEFV